MEQDDKKDGNGQLVTTPQPGVSPLLQSLSEERAFAQGAVEIQRTTTETVTHKKVSTEVVRVEPQTTAISLDRFRDPTLAQVIVNERDYWRSVSAELEESNRELRVREQGLRDANGALDKRCALAEHSLRSAGQIGVLESFLFAVGGVLAGAGFSNEKAILAGATGVLLIVVAVISMLKKVTKKEGGGNG
ncbi:hypothetical protein [Corallococcus sp. AB011P]|uniref:hypothetical protein n=1 Tax=Corallococcus sp. AB011P TaxID=2316735 RepID=UPI0011C44DB7|nr:hypothetical protein [Corallococcus sp. AB011P]